MVRPYTMTGGRSGTGLPKFALEALVAATPFGLRTKREFRWEVASIIELTRMETAVVELAALLNVPIGVVRVLIADLFDQGAVTIIDPPSEAIAGDVGHADLLQKVLDGIKSL